MENIKTFFGNPYYLMTVVLAIAAFGFAASAIISLIQERHQKKEADRLNDPEKQTDSEALEKKLGVDSRKLRKFLRGNEKKSNLKPQETTERSVEENEIHSEITEKSEKVETSPVSMIDTEPEELKPADVAEFQSRMIEHFRRKDTLQQSLIELLDIYESGPIYNRISEALSYSKAREIDRSLRDLQTLQDNKIKTADDLSKRLHEMDQLKSSTRKQLQALRSNQEDSETKKILDEYITIQKALSSGNFAAASEGKLENRLDEIEETYPIQDLLRRQSQTDQQEAQLSQTLKNMQSSSRRLAKLKRLQK